MVIEKATSIGEAILHYAVITHGDVILSNTVVIPKHGEAILKNLAVIQGWHRCKEAPYVPKGPAFATKAAILEPQRAHSVPHIHKGAATGPNLRDAGVA